MSARAQPRQKTADEPRRTTADSAATRSSAAGERAKKDNTISSTAQESAGHVAAVPRQIIGNYELGRVLATGDFDCRTRLCTHTTTGVPYVARVYDKDVLAEAQWMWDRVAESIRVQRTLPKNRHVLEMVECFESNTSVYILMHLFPSINVTKLFTDPAARGELLFRLHAASRAALRGAASSTPAAAETEGATAGAANVNRARGSPPSTENSRAGGDGATGGAAQPRTAPTDVRALQASELAASAGFAPAPHGNAVPTPKAGRSGSLRRTENVMWAPDAYSSGAMPPSGWTEADDAANQAAGEPRSSPGSPGTTPTPAAEAHGAMVLPTHMPLTLIRVLFQQAVKGVGHLHQHRVAHTGIAPDHLLVGPDGLLRLSNMVSCCFSNPGERMHGLRGTRHTVAPEVLRGESYDPYLADAWALGVVLYFMLNRGRYPHDGASTLRHILHGQIRPCRPGLPPTALDLLSRLLQPAPEERLPVDAILAHSFFTVALPTAAEEDAVEAALLEEMHARQLLRSMAAAALLQRGQGGGASSGVGGGSHGASGRRRWGNDTLIGDDAAAAATTTTAGAAAAAGGARREQAGQRRGSLVSFGSGGSGGGDSNSDGNNSSGSGGGGADANAVLGDNGDFTYGAASGAGAGVNGGGRGDNSRRSTGMSTTRSTVRSPRANLPTFRFLASAAPNSPGPGGLGSVGSIAGIGGVHPGVTAPSSHQVPSSVPSPTRRTSRGTLVSAVGLSSAEGDVLLRPLWRPEAAPSMEALEDLAARVIQYHYREVRRKQHYRAETRALVARSQNMRRGKAIEDPAAISTTSTSTGRYVAQLEQGLMSGGGGNGGVVLFDLVSPKAKSRREEKHAAPSALPSPAAPHPHPRRSLEGAGAVAPAKPKSAPPPSTASGAAASRRRTGGTAASAAGTANSASSGSLVETPFAPSRLHPGPPQRGGAAGGAAPSTAGRHSSGSGLALRAHTGSLGSGDLDDSTEQEPSFPSGLAAIMAVGSGTGTRGSVTSVEDKAVAAAARGGLDARRGSPTMPPLVTLSQRGGAGSVRNSLFLAQHGRRRSSTSALLPAVSGQPRGLNGSVGLVGERSRGVEGLPELREGEPCPLCRREPYVVRSIGIRPYAGTRFVYEEGGFTKLLSA